MNQTRSFLLFAWLLVAFLLFMEWSKTNTPATAAVTNATNGAIKAAATTQNQVGALPGVPVVNPSSAALTSVPSTVGALSSPVQTISIQTDVLKLKIDPRGATLVSTELLKYPVEKKSGSPNIVLQDTKAEDFFVAQSGFTGLSSENQEVIFTVENGQNNFVLNEGKQTLEIPFVWKDAASGLQVKKTLVLSRGSYAIKVKQELSNLGLKNWQGKAYEQFTRAQPPAPPKHSMFTNPESFSLVGVAWYSEQDTFKKKKFSDFSAEDLPNKNLSQSWISMVQHHFVSAWIPDKKQIREISTSTLPGSAGSHYVITSTGPALNLAAGKMLSEQAILWVGPKLQSELAKINPSLKKTLDYGYVTVISEPLFWLLSLLHSWIGNWGWAIIAIVVLLKLALYKLSAAQYKSMAKMRAIQPRLEALKERYGDDRQAYSTAMMDLYKKEKINPAGGCLPMLIPLPIFFALYWVLLESVELRQAPWMGWIQNLTAPDPYFILPIMNLIVMFVTQRLTPMPGMDPTQKKIMQFMPLMFGVLMAFFPAGLVLYWVTNGILGIAQQQIINKRHGDKPITAK
jgi:YidC/Oxa1 family membrane protein insertase